MKNLYLPLLFTCAFSAATLLSGCFSTHYQAPVTLTEKDSGGVVDMTTGQSFEVVLRENPTTGYMWITAPVDDPILKAVKADFKPDSKSKRITGAGGLSIMVFQAVKPGSSTLKMFYKRPWEMEKPARSFEVDVEVEAPQAQALPPNSRPQKR